MTFRMMKPLRFSMLSLDMQLMRNFWRNWIRESGDWSVALDKL